MDEVRRSDEVQWSDEVQRSDAGIFLCVPRPALRSVLPSGITRNPISPHYLGESGERHKSSDGPAKQEHASGQGPRLEETLVDQAIEQEYSLAQWEKLLREESSRGNDQ